MPERLTDAELDDLEDGADADTADLAIRARTELRDLRAEVERLNQENLAIRALPRAASEPSLAEGLTWEQVGAKNRAEKEEVRKLRAENEALRGSIDAALTDVRAYHRRLLEPSPHLVAAEWNLSSALSKTSYDATHSQVIGGAP